MTKFDEKKKVCFVGSFDIEYLKNAINNSICSRWYTYIFLENAAITEDLIYQYNYIFVKNGVGGGVSFYCNDIVGDMNINTGTASVECCVIAILDFCYGYIGVEMRDLILPLYAADKITFYNSVSITEAIQYISETESLVGIAVKLHCSDDYLDIVDEICSEMVNATKNITSFPVNVVVNVDDETEMKDCICDIFVCEDANRGLWENDAEEEIDIDDIIEFLFGKSIE